MFELVANSVEDSNTECPLRANLRHMNISYATDLWIGHLQSEKLHSDRTADTYRRLLDKFADYLPRHLDVDEVSIIHVRKFLDSQSRKKDGKRKSPATIAQNVSIVNGLFDWLTAEGVVKRNPCRRNGDRIMQRPRQVRPEDNDNIVSVSSHDARRLLEEANRSTWPEKLAVNLALYTGARRNALAHARVSDYDPVGRRLMFLEKGDKHIDKPVPHELAVIIESAVAAGVYGDDPDAYLIPSQATLRRDGSRDDRVVWRLIKDVAARARVSTHVHALRAAFAVHYLESHPGDLVSLQALMGHARIETTTVYLRRLDRSKAMESVRDLSWGTPAPAVELVEVEA